MFCFKNLKAPPCFICFIRGTFWTETELAEKGSLMRQPWYPKHSPVIDAARFTLSTGASHFVGKTLCCNKYRHSNRLVCDPTIENARSPDNKRFYCLRCNYSRYTGNNATLVQSRHNISSRGEEEALPILFEKNRNILHRRPRVLSNKGLFTWSIGRPALCRGLFRSSTRFSHRTRNKSQVTSSRNQRSSPTLHAGPYKGGTGVQCLGGVALLVRRDRKWSFTNEPVRFWSRLDLPYVPVWPGLSRFKRLSQCLVPVSKMSRNFTSVKYSKWNPAWWCIVMK